MKRLYLLLLLLFVSCADDPPAVQEQSHRLVIEKILEVSGLTDEMQRSAAGAFHHLVPYASVVPEERQSEYKSLVESSFNPRSMFLSLHSYWLQNADPDSVALLWEWLRTDQARATRELASDALREEHKEEMDAFYDAFESDALTQARLPFLDILEGGSGLATAKLLTDITVPTMHVLNTYQEEANILSEQEIEQSIAQMRDDLIAYFAGSTKRFIAYAYRDLSNEELQQYANFYETALGQWYRRLSRDAFAAVFTLAGDSYAAKLRHQFGDAPLDEQQSRALEYSIAPESLEADILGLMKLKRNTAAWYGFARARFAPDGRLVLFAQNNESLPAEHLEISIAFNGSGTYNLMQGDGKLFKVGEFNALQATFTTTGLSNDHVVIHHYDAENRILHGSLRMEVALEKDVIVFVGEGFSMRIEQGT